MGLNPKPAQRDQIGHAHHEQGARDGISLSSASPQALNLRAEPGKPRKRCSIWFSLHPSPPV